MPVMKVEFSNNINQNHFFDIQLTIKSISETIQLQLPAWRPGRYELQNFSRNIPNLKAYNIKNEEISCTKITRDKWEIETKNEIAVVKYSYFANKTDAGNSYVDEDIFYVNFINCVPFVVGELDMPIDIVLNVNKDSQIASALAFNLNDNLYEATAENYYQLYDSPTIVSKKIQVGKYLVDNTQFEIQIIGNYSPNWEVILPAFQAFSEYQLLQMGDFPFQKYQFIVWILPKPFYHGVEHANCTMITLGPDIEGDNLISDLIGVCSHELYHAWNICKIRPIEMLPYNYTKENYFTTGFIVEGVTTYLGDLFLVQSGVISKQEYLKELSTICMRHFLKDGQAAQSLVESSIDLWVDGYEAGIPNKKVSIYNKGALVALLLDLMIRDKFAHKKNIHTIMKGMWEKFGKFKIGYTLENYQKLAENIYGAPLNTYFNKYIFGTEPLEPILKKEFAKIGLEIVWVNESSIIVSEKNNLNKKQKINLENFLNNKEIATI
jgi:predicted metalloprotease with PDZ domain